MAFQRVLSYPSLSILLIEQAEGLIAVFGLRKDPATRLKIVMADRDVNTQELAYMTGLSPGTISRLRSGNVRRPKSDTVYLIAEALGVKVNSIWPDL